MADSFVVDTDVFVDYLRGRSKSLLPAGRKRISAITRVELFAGIRADEGLINRLLNGFDEVPLDRAIADDAARIRRASGLSLPDAVIAATALSHASAVITRNRSHFGRVPGLTVIEPAAA